MKFSTMMTVLAVALAMATTGCKYDKSKAGAGAGASDGNAMNIATDGYGNGEGNLSAAMGTNFWDSDKYTKCTDVDFAPVYFAFDSTVVPPAETPKADAVVQHLQAKPNRVVVVEGNCDERGANEYNLALGESRAAVVRNYLIQCGIAAERIQTRSFGEEKPANPGHDESAWAQNRRDDFSIYQAK